MSCQGMKCWAEPVPDSKTGWQGAGRVALPHGIPVQLGRSPQTVIQVPQCARIQVIITADHENGTFKIKSVGVNPSGLNGMMLVKNEEYSVEDGTLIEVLLNQFVYRLYFEKDSNQKPNLKRKNTEEVPTSSKKIRNDNESMSEKKINKKEEDKSSPNGAKRDLRDHFVNDKTNVKEISKSPETNNKQTFEILENNSLCVLTSPGVRPSSKIAAYDLDGTLITTKSGKKIPKPDDDWKIAFPKVPGKLKSLYNENYKIVVFTNQAGLGKNLTSINMFEKKLLSIIQRLGVPMQIFVSTEKSIYRKPNTGMWDYFCKQYNSNKTVDLKNSFYCGDAAGRIKDHSFVDKFFAENVGLKFYTPEENFQETSSAQFKAPSFDPKIIDRKYKNPDLAIDPQEILVMVGFAGCGKSTLSKRIEIQSKNKYACVCQDNIGSWQKCVNEADKYLQKGKSVIVDSTNLDVESRKRWINLAKKHKVFCRAVLFDVSIPHCKHNNLYRRVIDKNHPFISDMIYNTMSKKFVEPNSSEGFAEVIKVKFTPIFRDEQYEKLYFRHYLEK